MMLRNKVTIPLSNSGAQALGGNMRRVALIAFSNTGSTTLIKFGSVPTANDYDFAVTQSAPLTLWKDQVGDSITDSVFLFCSAAGITVTVTEIFTH